MITLVHNPQRDEDPDARPFPLWIAAVDPVLSRAESNGLFMAFFERRRRKGRVRYFISRAAPYFILIILLTVVIVGSLASMGYLGLVVGWFLLIALSFGVFMLRGFFWRSRRALPLYLESWLFGPRQPDLSDFLRLIPTDHLDIGEALLFERIERGWHVRLTAYWLVVATFICVILWYSWPIGLGDFSLAAAMIASAWWWRQAALMELSSRAARVLEDEVVSSTEDSSVGRGALALSHATNQLIYVPVVYGVAIIEAGLIYILTREILRAAAKSILVALNWGMGNGVLDSLSLEIAHAFLALLILGSFPWRHKVLSAIADHWEVKAHEHSVALSRMIARHLERSGE